VPHTESIQPVRLPPLNPQLPERCLLAKANPKEIIAKLQAGNQRFVKGHTSTESEVDIENPLAPTPALATVIADAHFEYSMQDIFDPPFGSIKPILISGGSFEANDGVMGSAEFLVEYFNTPVLVVLGHHHNDVTKLAVQQALTDKGYADIPKVDKKLDHFSLVEKAMPAALDAIAQSPRASFDELVYQANMLNLWRNVELLLTSSMTISSAVTEGKLQVHAAFFDQKTRKVKFWGEHPLQKNFLSKPPKTEFIRTAQCPPMASAEALAALYAGNKRYVNNTGGQFKLNDPDVLDALSNSGQNPVAVVVGCADSRAPVELIFDMRPGDLFVLRNAGNACNNKPDCNVKGSMDYAIANLRCRLVLVMGHTRCGAVTAAVELARSNQESTGLAGIDRVLSYIDEAAQQAVKEMPDASVVEQVKYATELNVRNTMKKIMAHSDIVSTRVAKMEVQVHGAIYDLLTGQVKWLNQHPDIESIVPEIPIGLQRWKTEPYVQARLASMPGRSPAAKDALQRLLEGNKRFMNGSKFELATNEDPFAVIISSSEAKSVAAHVFDQPASSIVEQRTMGGVESDSKSLPLISLEFAYLKYKPPIFLILVDPTSQLPDVALAQLYGVDTPSEAMRLVLSGLMVSCQSIASQVEQLNKDGLVRTRAGRRNLLKTLTAELDAFYIIDQIIHYSPLLREAIMQDKLELHVAVLDNHTGQTEFLGEHPKLQDLLKLHAAA